MAARILAGRYELSALVGRGGMGEVWEGRDRVIGRRVAVKLLPRQPDSAGAELFLREARTAGQLNHRGVITVFDIGQDPDDRTLFQVMEFVTGRDLATLVQRDGPLPVPHAVEWAAQAADALAAAHTAGVVHRDLKPANLMLTDGGEIKVLDFGIARFMAATGKSSQVMGTLAYMPPERFSQHPGDERSDLYALGCVLHELLTGGTPFQAADPVAMMTAHLNKAPTPPGELRPEVPGALDELVLKLLSKEAAHRPASAADVRDTLRALHAALPAPMAADPVPVAPRPSSVPAAPPPPGSPPASPGPSGPPATERDPRPAPDRGDQPFDHDPHALPTRTALPPRPASAPHPTAPRSTSLTRRRALWIGLGATAAAAGVGASLLSSGGHPADDQDTGSTGSAGGPSPSDSPSPVHRGWHYPLGAESGAKTPALGDKALYAIDEDACHALDLATGKRLWRARTEKESPDRVATAGSLVVVACRNVVVYAFDTAGKPKWEWSPNPRPQFGFEIGVRDDIVCVVVDKTLVCLNAKTGKPKWTFAADDPVTTVTPADGTVYVSNRRNDVYALHAGTGTRRWKLSAERNTQLGLTELPGEKSVVVVAGAKVRALDAGDGRQKWATTVKGVGSQGLSPAAVAGDTVYVGGDGRLAHALRAKDGRLLWSAGAGAGTTPAVAAGKVHVAGRTTDDASTVYALDAKDGSTIWSYDSGSDIDNLTSNHPLVQGGLVFVANDLGIDAIDAATGQTPPS